jgi:hypothetical protein
VAFSILKWDFITKKPLSAGMVRWHFVGATLQQNNDVGNKCRDGCGPIMNNLLFKYDNFSKIQIL